MYTEQDLINITKQFKKILGLLFAILLLFIGISIAIAKLVSNRLGMIVMVLGVCVDIFVWGMYATPIFAYYNFIKDLITGRTRDIEAIVKEMGSYPVYKDNKLYFYEVTIEEDGVERIVLLDDQKEWPHIHTNKVYSFQIHQNFVKDFKQIA